ncbi:hypothetical protein BRPE64_ACDS09110 [Caballeronia insecticola]|uniref:Uncharacterized protein n=1 Tax=Caballeronia insecticola TaxID=758793 RepID=R4WP50_9BURK|nr:hypothetical protein BRPE64_ACDS09110 [Caballeronia insecticola]
MHETSSSSLCCSLFRSDARAGIAGPGRAGASSAPKSCKHAMTYHA